MQIPIGLQTHPQLRGSLQEAAQSEGSIGGDGALAEHYLVQAVEGNAQTARSFDLPDTQRLQVFLEQDLAGSNRRTQPIRISIDSLRCRLRRHVHSPIGNAIAGFSLLYFAKVPN